MTQGVPAQEAGTAADPVRVRPVGPLRPDRRSTAITGLTTCAWYAVPDVLTPRWARAAAKVSVLAAGIGLGLATTTEGRGVLGGLRAARDGAAGDRPDARSDDASSTGGPADDANGPVMADALEGGTTSLPAGPVLAAAALTGATAVTVVLAVAGEKWAYRRGERWRERGLALPHTRVGLLVGGLAAGLTLLDPPCAAVVDAADGVSGELA